MRILATCFLISTAHLNLPSQILVAEAHMLPITVPSYGNGLFEISRDFVQGNDGYLYFHHYYADPLTDTLVQVIKRYDVQMNLLDSIDVSNNGSPMNYVNSIHEEGDALTIFGGNIDYDGALFSSSFMLKTLSLPPPLGVLSSTEIDYTDDILIIGKTTKNLLGHFVVPYMRASPPSWPPPSNAVTVLAEFDVDGHFVRANTIPLYWSWLGAIADLGNGKYGVSSTNNIGILNENFQLQQVLSVNSGNNENCNFSTKKTAFSDGHLFGFSCTKAANGNPGSNRRVDKVVKLAGSTLQPVEVASVPLDALDINHYDVQSEGECIAYSDGRVFFGNSYINSTAPEMYRSVISASLADTFGNVLWTKYFGSFGKISAQNFMFLPDGNLLISVYKDYYSSGPSSALTDRDFFYVRLDNAGNTVSTIENNRVGTGTVRCHPNPTQGVFYIENLSPGERFDVRVFDVAGNMVDQIRSTSSPLDISHLRPGLYFLTVEQKDGKHSIGKIILSP